MSSSPHFPFGYPPSQKFNYPYFRFPGQVLHHAPSTHESFTLWSEMKPSFLAENYHCTIPNRRHGISSKLPEGVRLPSPKVIKGNAVDQTASFLNDSSRILPDYRETTLLGHIQDDKVGLKKFSRRRNNDKPRRTRTTFSPKQLEALENEFQSQQYLAGAQRRRLSQMLNLTETQIKVWFQNRRTRWRKENFKLLQVD